MSLGMKPPLKAEELEGGGKKNPLILLEKLENSLRSQTVLWKRPRCVCRRVDCQKEPGSQLPWATVKSRRAKRPSTVQQWEAPSLLRAIDDAQRVVSGLPTPLTGQTRQRRVEGVGGVKLCWAGGHGGHSCHTALDKRLASQGEGQRERLAELNTQTQINWCRYRSSTTQTDGNRK